MVLTTLNKSYIVLEEIYYDRVLNIDIHHYLLANVLLFFLFYFLFYLLSSILFYVILFNLFLECIHNLRKKDLSGFLSPDLSYIFLIGFPSLLHLGGGSTFEPWKVFPRSLAKIILIDGASTIIPKKYSLFCRFCQRIRKAKDPI